MKEWLTGRTHHHCHHVHKLQDTSVTLPLVGPGCVCVCVCSIMPIATLYPPSELVVTLRRDLVITWYERSRCLMWTEFVPFHKAQADLERSERAGDVGRACALRKSLEARRATNSAACTPERDCESDGGEGGGGGGEAR